MKWQTSVFWILIAVSSIIAISSESVSDICNQKCGADENVKCEGDQTSLDTTECVCLKTGEVFNTEVKTCIVVIDFCKQKCGADENVKCIGYQTSLDTTDCLCVRTEEVFIIEEKKCKEIFEGDIIVDYIPKTQSPVAQDGRNFKNRDRRKDKSKRGMHHPRRKKRAATARAYKLWPHAVIPYEIEAHFSGEQRALFKQAMRYWENETCIQFVERNPFDHPDYIVFTERSCVCCSFVGRRGNGVQAISIGTNCDKFGIVVHELGHVVGFWHEHTRPDRDKHVKIITKNIMAGQEYNFDKLTEEDVNSLGFAYDYESIMHYARNTFSKSTALDTILPVRGKFAEMGQRVRLSPGDIAQTKMLYKCSECGRTYQAPSAQIQSPGFETGRTGRQHCEWRISVNEGERIAFEVISLDMDANCDDSYLEIRDGYWSKSPLLGRFCGSRTAGEKFVSTGHRILITYHSFRAYSYYKGFQAKYEVNKSNDTSGVLSESESHVLCEDKPYGEDNVSCECKESNKDFVSSDRICKVNKCRTTCGVNAGNESSVECNGNPFGEKSVSCSCKDKNMVFSSEKKQCKEEKGLSNFAICGVVLAVVATTGLIIVAVLYRKRKKNTSPPFYTMLSSHETISFENSLYSQTHFFEENSD